MELAKLRKYEDLVIRIPYESFTRRWTGVRIGVLECVLFFYLRVAMSVANTLLTRSHISCVSGDKLHATTWWNISGGRQWSCDSIL